MATDIQLQRLGARLVEREIYYCVSGLISTLAAREWDGSDGIDPDDLVTIAYRQPDADDYRECGADGAELFNVYERAIGGWTWRALDTDKPPMPGPIPETEGEGARDTEIEAWRDLFDQHGFDAPDGADVYEHWIVSDWLADELAERGEAVAKDIAGLTIWGRTTSGQSIALDSVIQDIALETYGEPDEPHNREMNERDRLVSPALAFLRKAAAFEMPKDDVRCTLVLAQLCDEATAIVMDAQEPRDGGEG